MSGDCVICGDEVDDYEPETCCDGYQCGCGGGDVGVCVCDNELCQYKHENPPYKPAPLSEIEIISIEINNLSFPFPSDRRPNGSLNVLTSRRPVFEYTRKGNIFYANDSGFLSAYEYDPKSTRGFAGREINLALDDGKVFKTNGQLWDTGAASQTCGDAFKTDSVSCGVSSVIEYNKCPVYCSGMVTRERYNDIISYLDFK